MKLAARMLFGIMSPAIIAIMGAGCARTPAQPPPTPEKPKVEQDLSRTTLTPAAAKSLQIRSEKLHAQHVREQLPLTGWIMPKQGHEVTITAPVGGYVRAPTDPRSFPVAGLPVKQDQEVLLMEPILSPLEQVQMAALKRTIESEWTKARESVVVAEKERERVQELFKQKLRGEQDREQAQARHKHALEDLSAAEFKRRLFADTGGEEARLKPISIRSPREGTALAVHVSPGQYVPAAAPLATVADLKDPWLRVPVPESELPRIDRKVEAVVVLRSAGRGTRTGKDESFTIALLAVVPQVDTARHTVDLIYQLPPEAIERGYFAKDQMLHVMIPLTAARDLKELVIPYSAVIFDAYGSAWIYFDVTPLMSEQRIYERRRVELGGNVTLTPEAYTGVPDGVVVWLRDKPSDQIVTVGASALFSREFHKPPMPTGAGG